ncbi:FAD:protein FMN transferase [Alicyclobacillus hesperidum subsp. aegles]|uniref:FAD:protein FMN transferase n=1 Tax=Alicyclobacillus hesperidum TaxID=89784 RepID=UPI00071926F7|nr:FAD:protein FMN transferase [Alicyclobacillus hesperidum]KRW91366.1 hypothetical protein SD51_09220 [Alicyclobacillus tengchongensis]GLG02711.1 FAD:protein FMN transferase [Alicyclobacillus hesperidum subsp. aegles]
MDIARFRAMGTDVTVHVPDVYHVPDDVGELLADGVQRLISEWESILTRFHPDSALSRFNRTNGHWVDVDPRLAAVLRLADQAFAETHGWFDPYLGEDIRRIGYDLSFEQLTVTYRPLEVSDRIAPSDSPLTLHATASRARLEPGYEVDLGGIGKGWIVRQAAQWLEQAGLTAFICNAGGDMVCRGMNGDEPWTIGVQDPFAPQATSLTLSVRDRAVATSGTYRRRWMTTNGPAHHLLDPFTGLPTESDVVSCTIVHRDLVRAEVQAKVALLLGFELGQNWLSQQDCDEWVLITSSREVVHRCNSL